MKRQLLFQLATMDDVEAITKIYDAIHTKEENGCLTIGWKREIYPTRITAISAIESGDMYVAQVNGNIVAAARINQEQVAEYADADWQYVVDPKHVMVLHTLVVDPNENGNGYGTAFVRFYEEFALQHNCEYLRMDTNEKNNIARKLYKKLGYREVGIVPCIFNGISDVNLVCLEKKLHHS